MPDLDAAWNRVPAPPMGRWRRFSASLPMRVSLMAVGVVWLLGCIWSFFEQSAFAGAKGFAFPHLLPLVIDGFAVSMAGVSWAASLDARPAIPARMATVVAVGASSTSNGVWAYLRTNHDLVTVVLGVAVPVAANLAFEVLLAELRRQVQRRRGLPPPVPVPYPRLIRLLLAPWQTVRAWRTMVLEITAMDHVRVQPRPEHSPEPADVVRPAETAPPAPPTSELPMRPSRAPITGPAPTVLEHPESKWRREAMPAASVQPAPSAAHPPATHQPADYPAPGDIAGQLDPQPITQPMPVAVPPAAPARSSAQQPTRQDAAPLREPTKPNRQPSEPEHPVTGTAQRTTEPAGTPDRRQPVDSSAAESGTDVAESVDVGPRQQTSGARRSPDPRIEHLVEIIMKSESGGEELTGDSVGKLFDVSQRSGRRLLGQARDLVSQRTRIENASESDPELSVIGGR